MLPESNGVIHWSISSVTKNPNMAKGLIEGPYKKQALVPESPWMDNVAPKAPQVTTTAKNGSLEISWLHTKPADVFHYVVYYKYGNVWSYKILNEFDTALQISITSGSTLKTPLTSIAVTAVDRVGNESVFSEIAITK
jgi:hypothetical protein